MTDLSQQVRLGRTGLMVSRLGIGSSYGLSRQGCLRAFDAGVTYFYWGSVRSRGMGLALRELAVSHRDELVVVLQTYARQATMLRRSLESGLRSLGIEVADILLLGWHDRAPTRRLVEAASDLQHRGLVRHLAISSHQRPRYSEYIQSGLYDVLHLRYNAAHRGAESEIFPLLPDLDRPGIVSYTNTRWGDLLKPANMPAGLTPPSATDCYRFALSHPAVDVAVCGPANDRELSDALETLTRGPLDEEELARMRLIGDHVHGIRSLMSVFS